jgi:hypothetical protein
MDTSSVCLGDRLAHSPPGFHRRAGLFHRRAGRAPACDRAQGLCPHLDVLDQDILDRVRDGRGHRYRHAVPVRHQLEPLLGRYRECALAAVRLRGLDCLLSRGGVPGRPAVRPQARAALGPISFRPCWSRWRLCSRPSGSWPPTAGCRRRMGTRSSMGNSSQRIGSR